MSPALLGSFSLRSQRRIHDARPRTGTTSPSCYCIKSPSAQGPQAYATQMRVDHPGLDETTLLADAVLAVEEFHAAVLIPDQSVIPPAS